MSLFRHQRPVTLAMLFALIICVTTVFYFGSGPWIQADDESATKLFLLARALGAMSDYRGQHRQFPHDYKADGETDCMNSWRLMLTNESLNYALSEDPIAPFDISSCWDSDPSAYRFIDIEWHKHFILSSRRDSKWQNHFTEIMAIVGPGAPFTEVVAGQRFKKIKDLPDDALLLIEVPDSKVNWMQAGDMQIADLEAAAKRKETLGAGASRHGRWVTFADKTIWLLDKDTPISALLPFCTVEGAKQHDRDDVLGDYLLHDFDTYHDYESHRE